MIWMVRHWNRFPRDTVGALSLEVPQGQIGQGFQQSGVVEGVPAHSREVRLDEL